ncbi:uncharacterized protein LOC132552778 [Ylistrum balloti]|uniref:uncharacterized protein LOC132552778 n=1 Tax=Ylistrum balloti TaxID=509963 RepID=UPI002905D16A|nr:uncharacterized protein LOC132552778 [Ylistrum balloti]
MENLNQYAPFQDYFGLSDITWNKDLLTNLNNLMTPITCQDDNTDCDGSNSNLNCWSFGWSFLDRDVGSTSMEHLDSIRIDSMDEFRHNGRELDLDDLDSYQVQLRHQSAKEKMAIQRESNPIVLQVLAFKEKKKAARRAKAKKVCVFCKNNGETSSVYTSHVLKDTEGKVSCPILRKYTCPLCGVNGDGAHTIKYCPKNEETDNSTPCLSSLLSTVRSSTCKRRRMQSEMSS